MKRLIKKFFLSGVAALLLSVAATGVASACIVGFYQPELPEE